MRASFQKKQTALTFLAQTCPKIDLVLEIQKTNVRIRIDILEMPCREFSGKTDNLGFFDPNFPKNWFWGRNFKNLSADSRSAPPRDHVCQFSVKMDNFEFFDLNLGKLPNYVQYFGSNNVEGVAESWVEAEMSWVEVGAWFSNTYFFNLKKK